MNQISSTRGEAVSGESTLAGRLGWVSFDMAGGPYFNIVKIFVFAPYFAKSVVGDALKGQQTWATIEGISGLAIALLSSIVGSWADAYGPRKPLIALLSLPVIAGLLLLWLAVPNAPVLPVAATLVAIAISSELAFLCHSSLLTRVASAAGVGRLSGLGFSANYLGTLIIFAAWLLPFGLAKVPALGLSRAAGEDVRIIGPICALWFTLFALPFFAFTPDEKRQGPSLAAAAGAGLSQLRETFAHARQYANIMRYLVARMVFFDGLVAAFTFLGIYATGTFGWTPAQVGLFGLIIFSVIVFAAAIGGYVDDRIGSKRAIMISVASVAACVALALGIGEHSVPFGRVLSESANATVLPIVGQLLSALGFTHLTEQLFILCGTAGGVFMGPALASSRTLLARIAPQSMMAQFFGLFTLSGKATSFLAPAAIGIVTSLTHSQRIGVSTVLFFLIAGLVLVARVREERAEALA